MTAAAKTTLRSALLRLHRGSPVGRWPCCHPAAIAAVAHVPPAGLAADLHPSVSRHRIAPPKGQFIRHLLARFPAPSHCNGFFEVKSGAQTLYTLNGQFQTDKDGFISNNQGMKLIGYPIDANGLIQPGAAAPLQLPTGGVAPKGTGTNTIEMNLDARQAITLPAGSPQVDFANAKSYNDATSVTVYDAKGQDVALTYYFQKTSTDHWNAYATANGTSVNVDAAGNPLPVTTMAFAANGGKPTAPLAAVTINIPSTANAAGATTLAIPGVALDVTRSHQFGSSFGVTSMAQDGYAAGQLAGVSIEKSGIVMATYSNGQSKPAGQVELAAFRDPQGLSPQGANLWARTVASGDPVVGVPGSGNLGVLQSGALEERTPT